jgi:predicted lipoprotein with Yx(FWY)xxD motif
MTRNLTAISLTAAVLAALVVAGCGGSSDSSGSTGGSSYGYGGSGSAANEGSTATEGSAAAKPPTSGSQGGGLTVVTVNSVPKLGKVIVNSKGLTLYDFHKDKGTTSSCYGGCAAVWPPLTTESKPMGLMGVPTSKLGTTKRNDGTTQVTFAGHPLYTYVEDTKPGEVKGNDFSSFGAQWYALAPSGEEAGD